MSTLKKILLSCCLTTLVLSPSQAQPNPPRATAQAPEVSRTELLQQVDLILQSLDSNSELFATQGEAQELRTLLLEVRKELQAPISKTGKSSIDLQRLQEITQSLRQPGL